MFDAAEKDGGVNTINVLSLIDVSITCETQIHSAYLTEQNKDLVWIWIIDAQLPEICLFHLACSSLIPDKVLRLYKCCFLVWSFGEHKFYSSRLPSCSTINISLNMATSLFANITLISVPAIRVPMAFIVEHHFLIWYKHYSYASLDEQNAE